jgi:hypothetical protein
MSGVIVIESPLNLEPVTPDSFIADLERRSPDAQAPFVHSGAAGGGRVSRSSEGVRSRRSRMRAIFS